MPTKVTIIERMGEKGLLLPELINRGLAANDRLKYYMTLLQAAHAHATAPRTPIHSLRTERQASGVTDMSLDLVVESSSEVGGNVLQIPRSESIVQHLFEDLRLMLEPVRIASTSRAELRARLEVYQRRLDHLVTRVPPCPDDQLTASTLGALTGLSGNGHDTAHQLAIDLQWELNRLQTGVLMETIDGASVYDITESDRGLIRAFVRGIHETAHLKFDHTGLETAATREGDRLSIQNDLGTTSAHVVVIHVDGLLVTVTYTDVHRARIQFLHDLLQPYDVKWTATAVADGADYAMSVGQYTADSPEVLERYLTFLGSRLVFLIDWNRARKRLARLVRKSAALALLKWAADNNIGHRAFLQAGEIRLIEAAFERAAPLHLRPGTRLDDWLGRERAASFLMAVLRMTSSGLTAGHSLSLIEDEIEAELLRYLESPDRHMLHGVAEQAAMISALAEHVAGTLTRVKRGDGREEIARTVELASAWSSRANQIAAHSLRVLERTSREGDLRHLLTEAGGASDALEETAHMLTLLPEAVDSKSLELLADLADRANGTVREYLRSLEEAQDLSPISPRTDVDNFLITIDRLVDFAGQTSRAQRALSERLVRGPGNGRDLYVIANMSHGFQRAVKSLGRCGVIVRDHVLSARGR